MITLKWNDEIDAEKCFSKMQISAKSEIQKQVVQHNVKQFFSRKLLICRICLETEDDSKGTANLIPISPEIYAFLNLNDYALPNMICTKCEKTVVDFMILMEMCEESSSFIQQVREEMIIVNDSEFVEKYDDKIEFVGDVDGVGEVLNIPDSESIATTIADLAEAKSETEEKLVESSGLLDNCIEFLTTNDSDEEHLNESNHTLRSTEVPKRMRSPTFKMIDNKYACIFCGKLCDTKRSHSTHVTTSHIRPHKCPVEGCTKAFGLPSMVRRHINQMHSEEERKIVVKKPDGTNLEITVNREKSGKLECVYCGQMYGRQCYLEAHIKKIHEEINLECNVCGKVFNEIRMKIHMKIHEKSYECNECGRRFVEKFLLKRHLLADHLKVNTYLCSDCGEKFGTAQKLRRHISKIHSIDSKKPHGLMPDDKKGYCKFCGLRFLDKTKLIKHVKEHTLVLKCKICAKKFASEVALEQHERTHKDVDYPYQCNSCDSRYETKPALMRHINKIHLTEQQWLCTICHKSLASARALDVHQKLHEGIKEYQCFLCQKEFSANRRLREHLIASHTESRYQCTECVVKCISQRGFEAHLRKDHPRKLKEQPDLSTYFIRDEPNHSKIMEQYQVWLRKLVKKRQESMKHRKEVGVEVIELDLSSYYDNDVKFSQDVEMTVE